MSNLNILLNTISYNDITPSANPMIRAFDFGFKNLGIQVQKPISNALIIPPGDTYTIFNGSRNTLQDSTTTYNLTQPSLAQQVYQITYASGTAPVFRTPRVISIDTTTQLTVTVNGPLAVLTNAGGTAMVFTNIQVGDTIYLGSTTGISFANQGFFTVTGVTASSLSFVDLNAVAETFTVLDPTNLLVFSNGSNNQIQIGDKLVISGGFSQASWGSYSVTAITPTWVQFAVGNPNGIPLESGIMPSTGLSFYSFNKSFLMIAAQDRCSILLNGATMDTELLEPIEPNNPEKPALYLKQGTVYSLAIKNLALDSLNVTVASAE
jgi:hypothetical protein